MWYESTNNVYGTTNNPYDLRRMVGGSSGGEGSLIAAAGAPVGLGSDIGGSIRMPAFFNGIWGLKPTGGVIPNEGQYPIAANEGLRYMTTGPLCRYVDDVWPMFTVLADPYFDRGGDGDDDEPPITPKKFPDPAAFDLKSLEFISVTEINHPFVQGVSPDLLRLQTRVETFLQESVGAKRKHLAPGQLHALKYSPDIWSSMLAAAGGKSFSLMCGDEKGEIRVWWEFLKFLVGRSPHTLMAIALAMFERLPEGIAPQKVREHCRQGKALREELASLLGKNGVLLFPSHPTVALPHHAPIFVPFNFAYTAILNVLEIPVIQCPLGLDSQGLPVGIQVGALHGNEHVAVAVARELSKEFGGWVPPPI